MKHFTQPKQIRIWVIALTLFIAGAGCKSQTATPDYRTQLAADPVANSYLTGILFSRNKDSITKCADMDYKENKYYIFRTSIPFEGMFDDYFAFYAKQKYGLTIVSYGCKNYPGACYYNNEMAECFSKANVKPLRFIYLEAKSNYTDELKMRYANH
jgi:hypothetical protein